MKISNLLQATDIYLIKGIFGTFILINLLSLMTRQRNRGNFKYYLAELIILILGITVSFVLNEWRVTQDEHKIEHEMLVQFRDNLVADSTALSAGIKGLDFMLESSNALLDMEARDDFKDSVTLHLARILNFTNFYPRDIAYEEMRSLGNSRMIQDKELLKGLIALYEGAYDIVAEWTAADRGFLLGDLIPFINKNLPFARGLNFPSLSPAAKRRLMISITGDEAKYMVQTGLIMKTGCQQVYQGTLDEVKRLIDEINLQLEAD